MHLRVKVYANAKREHVVETRPRYFEVWLKEKPEQNTANKRLVVVLAEHLGLPVTRLKIVRGHKKPTKVVLVREVV